MKHTGWIAGCLVVLVVMISGCRSMGIRSIPLETLKEKYHVSDANFLRVQGIDIHYKDEGQGPVLVLLHGICASLYTWDGWVDAMKDRYRIIRLDLPGWALTGSVGADAVNLDKMMSVLKDFFDMMAVDSFYLAGNSMGGYFAWNYGLKHPEQVKKMVLLDPVCYPQQPPWFIRVAKYPLLSFWPRRIMPKWLISMNVRAVYGDRSRIDPDLYDLYFDMAMREGNKDAYMDSFRFMAKHSTFDTLSRGVSDIKPPILLMYGSKDKWVPPEHGDLWKRDLPSVECIVYDGVGHVPMEEVPEMTANDADLFFSRS